MSGLLRIREALRGHWPLMLLCGFACWLVWPAPMGTMPLSQDHTVQVARAWMVGEELRGGHLSGWSSYWYFGFPVGELYPVLGDLLVGQLAVLPEEEHLAFLRPQVGDRLPQIFDQPFNLSFIFSGNLVAQFSQLLLCLIRQGICLVFQVNFLTTLFVCSRVLLSFTHHPLHIIFG